ncbi:iron complex outermembrane receptor protein [Sphingomonas sp. BK235]|nr:iron complex outermembrane receptor protein [Sphingomonas sp. BK235]
MTPEREPAGASPRDEITVTARRREEDAQQVPISLSVLADPGRTVTASASNASLARAVPNMAFFDGGGIYGNAFSIRGVGSISPMASDDMSVVAYVDDVPLSAYAIAPSLFDTERVEVLRGPQGTLFGRNTQAGAISIVSKRPSFERAFSLSGEIGSHGHRLGQAVANGAIVDGRLAGRVAVRWNHVAGDIPNVAAGGREGDATVGAARGSLLFTPDDETEALLTVSYGRDRSHSPRFMLRDTPDFPVSATDPKTFAIGTTGVANLRVRHAFDSVVLNSQTAFQRSRSSTNSDATDALVFARFPRRPGAAATFTVPGADVLGFSNDEDMVLQEVRASSVAGSAVAWTVGLNYVHLAATAGRDGHALTPPFDAQGGRQHNHLLVDSYAAFGEATFRIAGPLKATLGLRGTREDKHVRYRYDGAGLPRLPVRFLQDAALRDQFVTGRAMLSYDWAATFMSYASVARGHVTAGFPTYSVNSPLAKREAPFPASTSWTYEAGFKSHLLGDAVVLNGAAFLNDVDRGHLLLFSTTQVAFRTVALDYRTYGGELELTAHPTRDLHLFGGLGYTQAVLRHLPPNSPTGARSGNDVPNVPAFSGHVGGEYRRSAAAIGLPGTIAARASYQFVDKRAADVRNSFELGAYGITDARLTWEHGDLAIYGFVNNLFDKRYQAWGQLFGTIPTVRAGQGRVAGGGIGLRF